MSFITVLWFVCLKQYADTVFSNFWFASFFFAMNIHPFISFVFSGAIEFSSKSNICFCFILGNWETGKEPCKVTLENNLKVTVFFVSQFRILFRQKS